VAFGNAWWLGSVKNGEDMVTFLSRFEEMTKSKTKKVIGKCLWILQRKLSKI